MQPKGTMLLNRAEIAQLLDLGECIARVEEAFRQQAQPGGCRSGLLHLESGEAEFHIKAGGLKASANYFALKANGSCFQNMPRLGLPNIMGAIILFDADTGYPLAIMDSIEITIKRTGAGTALAAKYLASPDCATATICGCGNQGVIQLLALREVLPLRRVYAYDRDLNKSQAFARQMSQKLSLAVTSTQDLQEALFDSRVIVTCTPARKYFLPKKLVQPGTLVAAIGADSPEKQEIEPSLLVGNKVVVDLAEQCLAVGELHHAIEEKLLTADDVYAELGGIIAGQRPGRTSREEIIVYDATGTALQDAAAAAAVYEKARRAGRGAWFDFSHCQAAQGEVLNG